MRATVVDLSRSPPRVRRRRLQRSAGPTVGGDSGADSGGGGRWQWGP